MVLMQGQQWSSRDGGGDCWVWVHPLMGLVYPIGLVGPSLCLSLLVALGFNCIVCMCVHIEWVRESRRKRDTLGESFCNCCEYGEFSLGNFVCASLAFGCSCVCVLGVESRAKLFKMLFAIVVKAFLWTGEGLVLVVNLLLLLLAFCSPVFFPLVFRTQKVRERA